MSVSNVLVQQVYTTDGIVTSFPLPFAFLDDSAETVTKVYKVDEVTGVKTLQTIGALNDYTLPHDIDTQPANVIFNAAPDDCLILVTRLLDIEQVTEFINSGQRLLANIEETVDILTMLVQQVNELAVKSARLHEIDLLSSFDPVFPPGIGDIDNAGKTIILNDTGDGFSLGLSAEEISTLLTQAQAYAAAAASSATAASAFAGAAGVSAAAALASESAAAVSETNAAASAADAAASAAAAGGTGFTVYGPFSISDNSSLALTGVTADSALKTSVIYWYEVIRGTTVVATGWFSIHFINGAWRQPLDGGYTGDVHGVTWSLTGITIAQILATFDLGAGDGTVKLKEMSFAA